jgi:hypothetical protein
MRTLFFLTAILLLTLQAHSDPLPARVEEPSVQEQMEEVDTVITIFFTGVESSHFRDANKREGWRLALESDLDQSLNISPFIFSLNSQNQINTRNILSLMP